MALDDTDDNVVTEQAKKVFGSNLRRARLAAGLRQGELADRARVGGQRDISRWELGHNYPSVAHRARLHRALGLPNGDLDRDPESEAA